MWNNETENTIIAKTQKEVNITDYENTLKAQKQKIALAEDVDDEEADRILLALEDVREEEKTVDSINWMSDEIEHCIDRWLTKTIHYTFRQERANEEEQIDAYVCWDWSIIEIAIFWDIFWLIQLKTKDPKTWELSCTSIDDMSYHEELCSPTLADCLERVVELCGKLR